jgi:hypothetical protein
MEIALASPRIRLGTALIQGDGPLSWGSKWNMNLRAECIWLEQDAVSGDLGQGRTLVFAANVAGAKEVANVLAEVGLQPVLYHRDVPPQDRAAALDAMRARYTHNIKRECKLI